MPSHLSLTELAKELEARANAKQDIVVDTGSLHMNPSASLILDSEVLPVNKIAHDQIGARLSIPAVYYNRLRTEAPELLANNVNHWFEANPEKRLVRTLGGNVRAFLSDRYNRIENEEIASVVLPELLKQDGVQIKSCQITESKMYIKAVYSHIEGEVKKGDVVRAGVIISNSEVGLGTSKIQPYIDRCVCDNGLIIEDLKFTARHVGGRISNDDSIYEILSNEAIKADDRAILLKIRDVIRASFDEQAFAGRIIDMQAATADVITGNPAEAIKVLSKKFSFTDQEQGGILRHLIEGGDVSRWGALNAVTRTAQDIDDYDRSTEFEAFGGKILQFPKREWEQVATAVAA